MKTIEAYRCSDGAIFDCENKAKLHEDDLLGQELDGLLKVFNFDLTRNQQYKGLLLAMKSKEELLSAIRSILNILEFTE